MVTPGKAYFLVKINKQEQQQRIEKTGRFYNPTEVFMKRNMQSGEIVSIGEKAHEKFQDAKVGHTLIFHHFVEGDKESRKDALVFEDEFFNYYVISSYAQNGKAAEAYAVWDGTKIIPHPEYLLLEKEVALADIPHDEFINQAMEESKGGLLLFKEYKITRENNTDKLARLKQEVFSLSKTAMSDQVKIGIEEKEKEMAAITAEMNKVTYTPFTIAYANNILSEWFDRPVGSHDKIWCRKDACQTEIEFMGKEYLLCENKYIGFMLSNN